MLRVSPNLKFLNSERSLLMYFGPLIYGQTKLPFVPGAGTVKHEGLKYWPELSPLRGSQVKAGTSVTAFVPR